LPDLNPILSISGPEQLLKLFESCKYYTNLETATAVYVAMNLRKPVLVEGEPGVGKTELAKVVAEVLGAKLIRLQCYEGLDESKALYEWNYQKQLLRIQANNIRGLKWEDIKGDIYSEEYLLARPLLKALTSDEPVVLLIDEIDKTEEEFEAFLLEMLSDYQVTIPEIGTIKATNIPVVFLTSNGARDLSDALKRRCVYLWIDYPNFETELKIILNKVPKINKILAKKVVAAINKIRSLDLRKKPAISEAIEWAETLVLMAADDLDIDVLRQTVSIIAKYKEDQQTIISNVSDILDLGNIALDVDVGVDENMANVANEAHEETQEIQNVSGEDNAESKEDVVNIGENKDLFEEFLSSP